MVDGVEEWDERFSGACTEVECFDDWSGRLYCVERQGLGAVQRLTEKIASRGSR